MRFAWVRVTRIIYQKVRIGVTKVDRILFSLNFSLTLWFEQLSMSNLQINMIIKRPSCAKCTSLFILAFAIFASLTDSLGQVPPVTYPKVTAYVGAVSPLVTFSNGGTATNFNGHFVAGLATGINLWKSDNIGFSFEVVPFLRVEEGVSKVNNFLFHPGVLVALGGGFTFAGRAAFETSGRYGFTPVFSKAIIRNKNSSYFIALPLPVRFGNEHPTSATIALQLGLAF